MTEAERAPHQRQIPACAVLSRTPEGAEMKLFGQLVRTVVNVATLPVAVVQDVFTLGGVATDRPSYTIEKLKQLKEEAEEAR